jgi:hypothetical protein
MEYPAFSPMDAPDKIYLQIDETHIEEWGQVTWCEDRVYDTDVEYAKVKPRGQSGMPNGYSFEWETCPECGQPVKRNWLIRHLKSGCKLG